MPKGRVSAVLDEAAVGRIKAALGAIRAALPFLITLSKEERVGMVKLGPKSVDFVKKVRDLAAQRPGLVPADYDAAEFIKDADLYGVLGEFSEDFMQLAEAVHDTRMVAGSEAMVIALAMYGIFQDAQNLIPGLKDVVHEVGHRFRHAASPEVQAERAQKKADKEAARKAKKDEKAQEKKQKAQDKLKARGEKLPPSQGGQPQK